LLLAGPPFFFAPDYTLDKLTLPQALHAAILTREWQHAEKAWELESVSVAVAAGMGSKEAAAAIQDFCRREPGRRPQTFGDLLRKARQQQE